MKILPKGQYDYQNSEEQILNFWHSKNFFSTEYKPKNNIPFNGSWTLICPPPNAYDRPHIGNLSGYAYMDAMARYNRMIGKHVVMITGKDHAGLEGEATFIKDVLDKQGKSKFDFSRDEFYQMVWEHQAKFQKIIQEDEKRVGLSADFEKDLYTLDQRVVNMVLETFIELYNRGLIYKGVRIVNWDPVAKSTIPDNQCARKTRRAKLYYIKYYLYDANSGSSDFLVIATTRPETIFADTAVAINPDDDRYRHLIGKYIRIPITNKRIPIISSKRVVKDFGTGILKVTPAHANEDWEIMTEWNRENPDKKIDIVNVIDKELCYCGCVPSHYKGKSVYSVIDELINELHEKGHIEKIEEVEQNVVISDRTKAIIEPMITSQWFMDVSEFKDSLRDMVRTKAVDVHPQNMLGRFYDWVNKMRDWAISRNLWWGYRLPVWYAGDLKETIDGDGHVKVLININNEWHDFDPKNPDHMRVQIDSPGDGWKQDDDILDTWFSSGQWPYLTLRTYGLFDTNYPTDVLVSGSDLLVKWDLTMMLFSWAKYRDVPFRNLYLTGLVKGTDGQKMSKSRGNTVSLDEIIQNYGIDSFRLCCFYQNKAGRSYAITYDKLTIFRNFNNKIWNASKFVSMNLEDYQYFDELNNINNVSELKKFISDKGWNLDSKDNEFLDYIDQFENRYHSLFSKYRFGILTEELYQGFWHEFCDKYIEDTKNRLLKDRNTGNYKVSEDIRRATQTSIYFILKKYLYMLHPFVPFVTENIWQNIVQLGKFEEPMMYTRFFNI